MPELQGYDTYWEDLGGKVTYLTVNYYHYPKEKLPRNQIDIVNVRTSDNQDPMLVIEDYDRNYVRKIVTLRLLEMLEDDNGDG